MIRRDLEDRFAPICESYSKKYKTDVKYVFQDIGDLPVNVNVLREKPWGTGHAVLAARGLLKTPFAVINSDDFYGRDAFEKTCSFLSEPHDNSGKLSVCMTGYLLENNISSKGAVNRAICTVCDDKLKEITEIYNITSGNGMITGDLLSGEHIKLPGDSIISMNIWGFPLEMIEILKGMFIDFLSSNADDPMAEFLLPGAVEELLREDKAEVTVFRSAEKSFGMTREDDIDDVKSQIEALVKEGRYSNTNKGE